MRMIRSHCLERWGNGIASERRSSSAISNAAQPRNGEEGLALALKEQPDVILLDIIMPVMDGFSMLKKLRASRDYGAKAPVIVLSNLSLYNEDLEGDLGA